MKQINKRRLLTTLIILIHLFINAQSNWPFDIRINISDASCYNDALVSITIIDSNGDEIDTLISEISNIRYHYHNTLDDTTYYTSNSSFLLDNGTYFVGVSGIYHTHSGGDMEYILVDTTTSITIDNHYVPPHIYTISHVATEIDEYGIRPALACESTGRAQLNIDGGHFPYHIKVINQDTQDTIQNLIFEQPQYSGIDPLKYDYENYYTIDNLLFGNYYFLIIDGCGYEAMVANQTIPSVNAAEINKLEWFASSGDLTNHNVVKTQLTLNITYQYYRDRISDYFRYQTIFPNGDISNWKYLPTPNRINDENNTYILFDTAYTANSYCELWDTVKMTIQAHSCISIQESYQLKLEKPDEYFFVKNTQNQLLGSGEIATTYDPCSYTTPATVDTTSTDYYNWLQNYTFICEPNDIINPDRTTIQNYYTEPLKWIFIDEESGNIIKEASFYGIEESPKLKRDDVIDFYGRNFDDSALNLRIRNILQDARGCLIWDSTVQFIYQNIIQISGGVTREAFWGTGTSASSTRACCANNLRGVNITGSYLPIQSLDSIVIQITESPMNNFYNCTIKIFPGRDSMCVFKENPENNSQITYALYTSSIRLMIRDYCFASGNFVYAITTDCRTYNVSQTTSYNHYTTATIVEEPEFQLSPGCNELIILPTKGRFLQHQYSSNHPLAEADAIEDTIPAYFQIIDGPIGGYNDDVVPLNSPLRATIPGNYTIRMFYDGLSYVCSPEQYDTIIHYSTQQVNFKYAFAYVCDSLSTDGTIRIRGTNGNAPYTYTLYEMENKGGNVLAENQNGIFSNIPIHSGQRISANIEDSCGNSFYINLDVVELSKIQKAWFENGSQLANICEGESIHIYALQTFDDITYTWTGPNGFGSTTNDSQVSIEKGYQSGYYKVSLENTGCSQPIVDSIWIEVTPAPWVEIFQDTLLCPGAEATITLLPHGTGQIQYTLTKKENNTMFPYPFTGTNGIQQTHVYTALTDGTFWINNIHDERCAYLQIDDTIHVRIRQDVDYHDNLTIINDTFCYGSSAELKAKSAINTPYILNWYDSPLQNRIVYSDTITDNGFANHQFNNLQKDTNLYISAHNIQRCERKVSIAGDTLSRINAHIIDTANLSLMVLSALPAKIGDTLHLMATAPAAHQHSCTYQWFTRTQTANWQLYAEQTQQDTAIILIPIDTTLQSIRVLLNNTAIEGCSYLSTAQIDSIVNYPLLSLHIAAYPTQYSDSTQLIVTVINDGNVDANNIVISLYLPNYIDFTNPTDSLILINSIAKHSSFQTSITLATDNQSEHITPQFIKSQIAHCDGEDARANTIYGDWDWIRTTLQADEDTASIKIFPIYKDTIYDTVCRSEILYHNGRFHSIDISTAGNLIIDSTFHCHDGPDTLMTLILHIQFTLSNDVILDFECHDVNFNLDYGQCDTILPTPWTSNVTFNNVNNYPISITNNAGSLPPLVSGNYTITWILADSCGNTRTYPQHIHIQHAPCPEAVDYDGNHYPTVLIDCNCWTTQNLVAEHYSDGRDIVEKYAYYSTIYPNTADNVEKFGLLYSWRAAMDIDIGSGHMNTEYGICPEGWRPPTADEFQQLESYGDAIKSSLYWLDGGGSNAIGFCSLPAGMYNGELGRFEMLMAAAYYWCGDPQREYLYPIGCCINYHCDNVIVESVAKDLGYSVRCVKMKGA